MRRPLVSVVIPSFNQGRYIRETIDSVLSQDYRPLEVLVFDGASTDGTLDVLRSYGSQPDLQWWSEKDRGVVDAVNKGLRRAQGEIVAIQSSDDVYTAGAISRAVEAFDEATGMVFGEVEFIDADSCITGRTRQPPWSLAAYLGKRLYVPQPAAFFTREAADACGGWRDDISYAADAEYYLRIATRYGVKKLDEVLARYRYHDEQRDKARRRISADWERAVKDWIRDNRPSRALAREAMAGVHLTHAHYMTDEEWWQRTKELYKVTVITPSRLLEPAFPRRELLPGRQPILRFLSRVKRRLGFPPKRGRRD